MSEYFRKPIVKTLMLKGQEGQSIKGIEKTGTSGLVDTYTVTLTDGTTSTFTVANGKGISSISKTGTSGLVDTYTITYNDGTTSTFTVENGEGIQNLQIGGRNLYKDTQYFNDPSVWGNYNGWTKALETYKGFTVMTRNHGWGGMFQKIYVKAGETYTFSAYVKNTSDTTASILPADSSLGDNIANDEMTHVSITKSQDFHKVSAIISVLSDGLISPKIELDTTPSSGEISVCGFKLERGSIATDWTPAPEDLKLAPYPVGSIYMSINSTSPASLFGGTWEQLKDRFLLAAGDTYTAGSTGGESTHTLTVDEMPSHTHEIDRGWGSDSSSSSHKVYADNSLKYSNYSDSALITRSTGGGKPHNNMPPYLAVYMWKRIA